MKQFRTFILFAAVAIFGAVACVEPVPDSLTLTDAEITAPASGLTQDLVFTTNVPWSVQSSESWISVNPSEGQAGDVKAKLTIAANDTYEDRSATVVVTAGSLSATLTVSQTYARVFELQGNSTAELDSKAQTIEFAVNSNLTYQVAVEAGCDWITPVASKAAPKVDRLGFNVAANESVEARSAKITITPSEGAAVECTVSQAADAGKMLVTSVKYISNRQKVWISDENGGHYSNVAQYVIDAQVVGGTARLVLTSKMVEKPLESIPALPFETDTKDSYADSTITIGATGHEYYTTLVIDGAEKGLTDVLAEVKKVDGGYSIEAKFADESSKIYEYSFTGALPAIEDESKGVVVSSISYKADYYTHFATGAEETNFTLYPSREVSDPESIYWLEFTVAAAKGTGVKVPTGTFTLGEDTQIESSYANGVDNHKPGTFLANSVYSKYVYATKDSDASYEECEITAGTVTISQAAKGYKFDFDLTVKATTGHWSENWDWIIDTERSFNFKKSYDNVAVPEITNNQNPVAEDADCEFTVAFPSNQYIGFYIGNTYEEYSKVPGTTFMFGWSAGVAHNYTVQLAVNTSAAYELNTNYGGRYSDAPIPAGTYTFQKYAVDGTDCIPNIKRNNNFNVIKNSYTGTNAYVDGGSIKITDSNVTFDLYASTADYSKRFHYTGTMPASVMYIQNRSTTASYKNIAAWNPNFLYPASDPDHENFDDPVDYNW